MGIVVDMQTDGRRYLAAIEGSYSASDFDTNDAVD